MWWGLLVFPRPKELQDQHGYYAPQAAIGEPNNRSSREEHRVISGHTQAHAVF